MEEDRLTSLRERAKKLISDARQGLLNSEALRSFDSSISSNSNSTNATPSFVSPSTSCTNNLANIINNNESPSKIKSLTSKTNPGFNLFWF